MYTYIKQRKEILVCILLSIIIFYFQYGVGILNPTNIYWFLDDPYQSFIGWSFYRNADFFTYPLFKNYNLGMEIGSTIIYTDSLPLMAILFKPFSQFLPVDFQYLGMWILLCYILMAYFGYKIFNLYITGSYEKLICVLLLLISPIFLQRFNNGHIALMSHWIILCSFYIYLNKNYRLRFWLILILLSSLVHAFILAMVLIIASFSTMKNIFNESISRETMGRYLRFSLHLTTIVLFTFFCLYTFGYFDMNSERLDHGWGGYRLNLLSIINPEGLRTNWSMITGNIFTYENSRIGDYEGFNYLGLGMIINMLLAIFLIINKKIMFSSANSKLIIIFCLLLIIFSLTNHIAFGPYELLSYNFPEFLKIFTAPFRASGRFFWPVYYIIFISTLVIAFKHLDSKKVLVYALAILLIQVVDLSGGMRMINRISTNNQYSPLPKESLKIPGLDAVAKDYEKLIYVFPSYAPKNWIQLTYFAYRNNLKTNFMYFGRRNKTAEDRYISKIRLQFEKNNISKDSIYYFSDKKLWESFYSKVSNTSKKIEIIDNHGKSHLIILPDK